MGVAFAALWIATLTLLMGAAAAWITIGSKVAALTFLGAGLTLAPPVQQWLGEVRHKLLPARLAFYAMITLVPIGLLFVIIDGVAQLEVEARQRGFASAGKMARARDLGFDTPVALAAYEDKARIARLQDQCREHLANRPLDCFDTPHRHAALMIARSVLGDGAYPHVLRDAIARQRQALSAVDRNCATLLDRIDEDAVPALLDRPQEAAGLVAAIWARRLSRAELEQLAARAKPGVTFVPASSTDAGLQSKVAGLAPALDGEVDAALQAWSVRFIKEEPVWRALLRGRGPLGTCKPADEIAVR